jgi:hypothetical protein
MNRWRQVCLIALQVTAANIVLALAGCSTAPVADFLDYWSPGKFPASPKGVAGGVCVPQGGQAVGLVAGPPPGAPGFTAPGVPAGPQVSPDPPTAPITATPMQRTE